MDSRLPLPPNEKQLPTDLHATISGTEPGCSETVASMDSSSSEEGTSSKSSDSWSIAIERYPTLQDWQLKIEERLALVVAQKLPSNEAELASYRGLIDRLDMTVFRGFEFFFNLRMREMRKTKINLSLEDLGL